jgi:hypothetical protein
MSRKANSQGWDELVMLARRPTVGDRVVVDLREASAMLLLRNGRVAVARVAPAPDGEYQLERAGSLVVRHGLLTQVVGTPEAPVLAIPSP